MKWIHPIEKGYMSTGEASRYRGVKPSTIRNWAKEGKILHYKPGRTYWFKKEEIDASMGSHRGEGAVVDKMVKRVFETAKNPAKSPKPDVEGVVRKAIEEARKSSYTGNDGKPDQIKGLRKEVKNGNI